MDDESNFNDAFVSRSVWLPSISFVLALLFAFAGIGLTALRTYKNHAPLSREFDFGRLGMFDFHNGGYQPALAFREGISPYSAEICEKYMLTRPVPTYSPVVFLEHVPFSFLPLTAADMSYFAFSVALIGLLAFWSIRMSNAKFGWAGWLALLGLLVFSRPGHISLYTGYFTPILVVGTIMALHFGKSNPVLSGIGLLLASGKPTYIIPLVILMLVRKNYRAVATGLVFSSVVALGGLGWLAYNSSFEEVIGGIQQTQAEHLADENEIPMNTWTRIDVVGSIAKVVAWDPGNQTYLAMMMGLLVLPAIAIWKATDQESNHGATGITAMIACLAILLSIYHHSYDGLLLAVPWVGVTFFGDKVCPELTRTQRFTLTVLMGVPAANYASTLKFRDLFGLDNQDIAWHIITSINGACLLVALVMLIWVAWRLEGLKAEGLKGRS